MVEILVVIAIIGVLAGMIFVALQGVKNQRVRKLASAQLAQLETAIQRYHDDKGFFPPSDQASPATNRLYYELVGTRPDGSGGYRTLDNLHGISAANMGLSFGLAVTSFVNSDLQGSAPSATDPDSGATAKNYLSSLKDYQVKTNDFGARLLVALAEGPNGDFNPWSYLAPGIHNAEGYDLWVDVKLGSKIVRIGNWKGAQ